jgi:hypothetical protein
MKVWDLNLNTSGTGGSDGKDQSRGLRGCGRVGRDTRDLVRFLGRVECKKGIYATNARM